MVYLCDCHDSRQNFDLRKANDGKGKMQPTEVNDEGYCVHCGNYAPAFRSIPATKEGTRQNYTIDWILSAYYGEHTQRELRAKQGYGLTTVARGEAKKHNYDNGYAKWLIEESDAFLDKVTEWNRDVK